MWRGMGANLPCTPPCLQVNITVEPLASATRPDIRPLTAAPVAAPPPPPTPPRGPPEPPAADPFKPSERRHLGGPAAMPAPGCLLPGHACCLPAPHTRSGPFPSLRHCPVMTVYSLLFSLAVPPYRSLLGAQRGGPGRGDRHPQRHHRPQVAHRTHREVSGGAGPGQGAGLRWAALVSHG